MKLSELINNAHEAMDRYGDIEVWIDIPDDIGLAKETMVISESGMNYKPAFIIEGDF